MANRNSPQKSVMKHSFSDVPRADIPRSSFDRSHGYKTTFDAGYLIPCFVDEALPGDTFNLKMTAFARLATPITPFMDNMRMDTQFFAVPIRLIWENWQKFNGEQQHPGDSTDFLIPQVTAPAGGYLSSSLSDYFGIPTGVDITTSSLWHRAYNLVYNEWYRDQNLQTSANLEIDDGPDAPTWFFLQRRGKRPDYFTSALPWPQKGDSVDLPLGTSAPVVPFGPIPSFENISSAQTGNLNWSASGDVAMGVAGAPAGLMGWNETGLVTDLSDATAATINQLRQAFQVQKMLERDARGGTRYTEIIKSHFGVSSPDARLQRPEYLGGGSSPIYINPVAQTQASAATTDTPQANLAAVGTVNIDNHGFTKSFTEHCILIGIVSVRADLTYQQGLNRMFSRQTRFDYYWPALSHIGEQAILMKEILSQGTSDDELVFGYQERFAEYRYKPSVITGKFRSNDPQSLDYWHLSQEFENLPVLGAEFIEENPPVDRVIAVTDEPHFLFDAYFSLRCARPMPMFGTPGLIDHF